MLDLFYALKMKIIAVFAGLLISLGVVYVPPVPPQTYHREKRPETGIVLSTSTSPSLSLKEELPKLPPKSPPPKSKNESFVPGPVRQAVAIPETLPRLIPSAELNTNTREALVNILCVTKTGGFLNPISGSGVIIDPRGVILTNAHITQYFLLKDYHQPDFVDCAIRLGSPAKSLYRAKILYLPPLWIKENADYIKRGKAKVTGEGDYAMLLISETISGDSLPNRFPFIEPDGDFTPLVNHPILVAAYPAEFLSGHSIQKELWPSSAISAVNISYYFSNPNPSTPDLLGLGGTVIAQSGSSGGAVVDQYSGKLVAIIVTTTVADTTGERDLHGLTLNHISRALSAETKETLSSLLAKNPAEVALAFQRDLFDILKDKLIKALEN